MCHSVEMYLPEMTRRAANERIAEADFAAAERERRVVGAGLGLVARIRVWLKGGAVEGLTREMVEHG